MSHAVVASPYFPTVSLNLSQSSHRRRLFTWGMICIGQKRFRKALEFLHNVVTAPMSTINAIAIEAYKKYILVSLIHLGQIPESMEFVDQMKRLFREIENGDMVFLPDNIPSSSNSEIYGMSGGLFASLISSGNSNPGNLKPIDDANSKNYVGTTSSSADLPCNCYLLIRSSMDQAPSTKAPNITIDGELVWLNPGNNHELLWDYGMCVDTSRGAAVRLLAEGLNLLDYREHNDDTTVHFEVIMSEENLIMAKQEGLLKKFKLTTTISTSNMHLFDPKGVIKKYETPEQSLIVLDTSSD
ncbi:DNA topoisomerase 2 [Camellia lanceoleosa]|uniref:DNA topoisomerase 2 n=1 Tax=Camellia lanceoleosa TaxID=1840588 RepID=A0ACC0IWY7_9ERIC|nr:DNA topoisomerase 2 [Camellia lanceoleosa]